MMKRLAAIGFIFVCTSIAWMILGATIFSRTSESQNTLDGKVASTWGAPQEQKPPEFISQELTLPIDSTTAQVRIDLSHRLKGLLYYSTYQVYFNATYTVQNPTEFEQLVVVEWPFPAEKAVYDDLLFNVDGKPLTAFATGKSATATFMMPAHGTASFGVRYGSQGLDSWHYNFGSNVSQVHNFKLDLTTNFADVDFPDSSLSPVEKRRVGSGWSLNWSYRNLVSGYQIALTMPEALQPGPLAGQISLFAPVSLFFFFFVVLVVTILRGIDLHPVNYFFLAAAFFAFHLLLAYMVDHVSIYIAFVVASIVTLFVLMQATGRVQWAQRLAYISSPEKIT